VFDPLSPLYVKPSWNPGLVRWLWDFSKHCTESRLHESLELMGVLGHRTSDLFDQLVGEEGLECDYSRGGYYEIYSTETALAAARREADMTVIHGYHPESTSGAELREREPSIRAHILGGVFFPDAATIDPYRFVSALADSAQRHGVKFRTNCEVAAISVRGAAVGGVKLQNGESIEADTVVVATGAYSASLTKPLVPKFPLQAAKGYHRDSPPGAEKRPSLSKTVMFGERSVYCCPMSGFERYAGTLEFSGINHDLRRPRLEQLTKSADLYIHDVEHRDFRSEWCGLRPCLPDGYPAMGPVPGIRGFFLATGHAMLGLTLGPVTGQLMAEIILDGAPSINIRAFGVERFT
jgi:D-amino-acid dehydrogenase